MLRYGPPWRGGGLFYSPVSWAWAGLCDCLDEQNILEAQWHGFWDWLYSFCWVSAVCLDRICSPWEPRRHAVRKLSLAHMERPLKWAHVERNWGPPVYSQQQQSDTWASEPSEDSHPGLWAPQLRLRDLSIMGVASHPTVPCPNSWPRGSTNVINGIYTTKFRPACYPGIKTSLKRRDYTRDVAEPVSSGCLG